MSKKLKQNQDWKKTWFDYDPESNLIKFVKTHIEWFILFPIFVLIFGFVCCDILHPIFFLISVIACLTCVYPFEPFSSKKIETVRSSENYFNILNKTLEELNTNGFIKDVDVETCSIKLQLDEKILKNFKDRAFLTNKGVYLKGLHTIKYLAFIEILQILPTENVNYLRIVYYNKPSEVIRNFLSPEDAAILYYVWFQSK